MSESSHGARSWAITEENAAFRIVDPTGKVLAEIPFAHRSVSNLSRGEAKRMAEGMIAAGTILSGTDVPPSRHDDF